MKSFLQHLLESKLKKSRIVVPDQQMWVPSNRLYGRETSRLSIPDEAQQVLRDYGGTNNSWNVNQLLRHGPSHVEAGSLQRTQDLIGKLDDTFRKYATTSTRPLTVYRSVHSQHAVSGQDRGYMSTSTSPAFAFLHAAYPKAWKAGNPRSVLRIHVPADTPYLPVSGTSYSGNENELLFSRGHHLEVEKTPMPIRVGMVGKHDSDRTRGAEVDMFNARIKAAQKNPLDGVGSEGT